MSGCPGPRTACPSYRGSGFTLVKKTGESANETGGLYDRGTDSSPAVRPGDGRSPERSPSGDWLYIGSIGVFTRGAERPRTTAGRHERCCATRNQQPSGGNSRDECPVEYHELPEVIADPTQMVHLMQNLVGNALKFHGASPSRISIKAKTEEGNGSSLIPNLTFALRWTRTRHESVVARLSYGTRENTNFGK